MGNAQGGPAGGGHGHTLLHNHRNKFFKSFHKSNSLQNVHQKERERSMSTNIREKSKSSESLPVRGLSLKESAEMEFNYPLSNIEFGALLGRGASGIVRVATLKKENRIVAVKSLSPVSSEEEFENEVHISMKVKHPNVLETIGACCTMEGRHIIMELVANGSLCDLLHKPKSSAPQLTWELIILTLLDIAKGIHALHSIDVLHRDLKPDNVLMASFSTDPEEVRAKISDFGSAREASIMMTRNTGTPQYMAPEVFSSSYTTQADIFSFGITAYEAVTKSIPFEILKWPYAIQNAIMEGKRPALPESTPNMIKLLIEAAWAQAPTERPSSSHLVIALETIFKSVGTFGVTFHQHCKQAAEISGEKEAKKKIPEKQIECSSIFEEIVEFLWVGNASGTNFEDYLDTATLVAKCLQIKTDIPESSLDKLHALAQDWQILLSIQGENIDRLRLDQINHAISFLIAPLLGDSMDERFYAVSYLGDTDAKELWTKAFGLEALSGDWPTFVRLLEDCLQKKLSSVEEKTLSYTLDSSQTGYITVHKLAAVLKWAGPLRSLVDNIVCLWDKPYFHPFLSFEDTLLLLKSQPIGSYLIRFRQSLPGTFTAAVKLSEESMPQVTITPFSPTEFRISGDSRVFKSLDEIIDAFATILSRPVRNPKISPGIMKGSIESAETVQLLSNEPIGTYLVRLSKSSPGDYVIGYIAKKNSIQQLIIKYHKEQFWLGDVPYPSLGAIIDTKSSVFVHPRLSNNAHLTKLVNTFRSLAEPGKRPEYLPSFVTEADKQAALNKHGSAKQRYAAAFD